MTARMDEILAPGRVAVITGAAKGIGAATASSLAKRGMKLALFDQDADALVKLAQTLPTEVLTSSGDVTDLDALVRLRDHTVSRFGDVSLLMNNAAILTKVGPWGDPAEWKRQLDANLGAVQLGLHVFVPGMIASERPSTIVNLGSKEGITTPPGKAAYSVSKAGLKVLTEQLVHELRAVAGDRVSAHLLVPGLTWTPMNVAAFGRDEGDRPADAWTAQELVDHFTRHLLAEDFYIICPDNGVTSEMDRKRIQWAADDMLQNRPALSRWHPDWKERFAAWMAR